MTRRAILVLAAGLAIFAPVRGESQRALAAGDPNLNAGWDWRTEEFHDLYLSRSLAEAPRHERIRLPFRMAGNRLSQGLGQIHPEDGWMLVHRDFGTPDQGLQMPYFTLYNRYRGLFRVIVFNAEEREDSIYLGHLRLHNPGLDPRHATPSFTFANDRGACFLSNFDTEQTITAVTTMDKHADWAVFDYHLLGYDPDLPNKDPLLTFRIEAVRKTQIRMTGEGVMKLWQMAPTSMVPGAPNDVEFKDAALSVAQTAWAFRSAQDWLKTARADPANEGKAWFELLVAAGSSGPLGSLVPVAYAMFGTLSSFVGGASRASAYEPIAFQGQQKFWIDGSLESRSQIITLNLAFNQTPLGTHLVTTHRPVQKIPWGIFNLEKAPVITGPGRIAHLAATPKLIVNPECGLALQSATWHLNIHEPTWAFDSHTKRRVVTNFTPRNLPITETSALPLGGGFLKDLVVNLKFSTLAPTLEADKDIVVLKTVPVAWERTQPGTYALEEHHKGSTYLFPRFHPTDPRGR